MKWINSSCRVLHTVLRCWRYYGCMIARGSWIHDRSSSGPGWEDQG
jgi:hypothetical protein